MGCFEGEWEAEAMNKRPREEVKDLEMELLRLEDLVYCMQCLTQDMMS
jgi:hypothetical protein